MLTAPVAITFDDDTGRLTVVRQSSAEALQVEDDMLDPALIDNPSLINAIRSDARDHEDHPLHREATLDARGQYDDGDAPTRPTDDATAAFAPALILRKRSQKGLIDIFTSIIEQISTTGFVPDGVVPLVDPDRQPTTEHDSSSGALVMVDDDPFLPLPVNDKQLRILRQVDAKAQTLVQGPPGTGKTHTAAVLIFASPRAGQACPHHCAYGPGAEGGPRAPATAPGSMRRPARR